MLGPTGRALTWVTPASQEGFLLPLKEYLLKPDRPLKPIGARAFRKCWQLGQWTVRLPVQGPLARLLMSRRCPSVHPPEYTQDQVETRRLPFPALSPILSAFPAQIIQSGSASLGGGPGWKTPKVLPPQILIHLEITAWNVIQQLRLLKVHIRRLVPRPPSARRWL